MRLGSLVVGGAALAACTPKTPAPAPTTAVQPKPQEQPTPKPAPAEKVALTWLVRSHPVENPWEENSVLPAMKEKYPNVSINLVVTPGGEWAGKVMSMYAGGTPPDVHNGIVGTFIQLYAQDKVLPLDPYIDRDGFDIAPFGPLVFDPDCCRSGHLFALPILTTLGCPMFYNVDLLQAAGFEQPPTDWQDRSWTWERVLEMAKKLTKNYGLPDAVYGFNGVNQYHCWAYAWGGDCWAEEWYARGISMAPFYVSDAVVDGCDTYRKMIHEYQVTPTPSDAAAIAQLGNPFKTGRLAMEWTGGWGYWNYFDITAFKWGAAPQPWGKSNKCVNWTDPVLAAKDSKSPDMAWALVKYLTSKEGQTTYAQVTHTPPTREDAMDPWLDYLEPLMALNRDQLKQVALGYRGAYQDNWAHYTVKAGEYQTIQNQEGDVMWSNKKTAAEHMPDIATKMNAVGQRVYEEFKNTRLSTDTLCAPL
jgi:multiple sugar transport system substrate-binding protein